MKKLYVTKINKNDKSEAGITSDLEKIKYNINTIRRGALTMIVEDTLEHPIVAFIESIGQFICICNLSTNDQKYSMTFLDVRNDYNKFIKIADKMDDENDAKRLTICYDKCRQSTEEFELTDGNLPESSKSE